jgi:uncharacterized protein with PQ loop repeat
MLAFLRRLLANSDHHHFVDYLAGINSGISALALFPQFFELLESRSAAGLSVTSFFLIALNSVIWFIYAVHRRTPPLVISSTFNIVASVGILVLIYYHR